MSRGLGGRIFVIFAVGYFLSYSFRSLGPLIAPDLAGELDLNARELGLLASVYFLAFFAAQAPVGIAMDRFGPARVNAGLFVIAAAGSVVFALGQDVRVLAAGRAMIGFGVAGALMTSFKAFVIWFEPRHREILTGGITAVGGLAAMMSATPAEWIMRQIEWRGLFWLLAGCSLLAAVLFAYAVPGDRAPAGEPPPGNGRGGYAQVLGSRIFLSYAPLAFFGSGGFSAIQSLWAGPWLIEVAGVSRGAAADVLFVYGTSLLVGNLMVGAVASRLQRWPGATRRWYVGALAFAAVSLGTIISNAFPASSGPWFAYGLTLGAGMLAYPALTRAFPAAITGRVVTSYNMVMFMGAFAIQSALGVSIQSMVDAGWPRVQAYQWSFGGLLATQLAALLWVVVVSRRG